MKSHHVTWICVIGTSTVAGLLVGNLATREPAATVTSDAEGDRPLDIAWENAPSSYAESAFGPSNVRVAELEQDDTPTQSTPPAVLPHSDDAAPIIAPEEPETADESPEGRRRPAASEALVRDMIAHELPNTSPEERDIWYEELKGLPTDKLVEVLRIRKYLGSTVPLPKLPEIEDPLPPVDELPPIAEPTDLVPTIVDVEPPRFHGGASASVRPYGSLALENSLHAIAKAERVHLNNIANANTPGFRRRRPLLGDLPRADPGSNRGNGCHLACTQIDDSQGPLVATDRPLDVAVVGRGFLQFTKGDRIVYGRCGALRLNADGQLISLTGLPVEPSITCPDDATTVIIGSDGSVMAHTSDGRPTQIGNMQLAVFSNPSGLTPVGNAMFDETEASGVPRIANPGDDGTGSLRSGCLEAANVDLEVEQRELQRLRRQASVIRELLGEPSQPVESPNLARPPESGLHRTSATDAPGIDHRDTAAHGSPGPFLVLRPDMLPQ